MYKTTIANQNYKFKHLRDLMAKATPARSGDYLAGIAAAHNIERVAAQWVLADVPLKQFLNEVLVPYEDDEVTRLIIDDHNSVAFAPVSHLTVGDFRNWLLSEHATTETLTAIATGLTPEMVAAVSKIMRIQDLILVAKKCQIVTRFRNTIGLKNRLSTRLQPNHPTDNPAGVAASILDGLLYGCGDAVIGINPASDNFMATTQLIQMLHDIIDRYQIPTQSCVLAHVTTTLKAIEQGYPVDLVFQSIAGTQKANDSFGINLNLLNEAHLAALELNRGTIGNNCMYFETGQGSALSANAHEGLDQQTCETRAMKSWCALARCLVATVVCSRRRSRRAKCTRTTASGTLMHTNMLMKSANTTRLQDYWCRKSTAPSSSKQ